MTLAACTSEDVLNRLDQTEKDIAQLKGDVAQLQQDVNKINSDISGLQSIVKALEKNVYVKEVTDVKDASGSVIGYTITFTDNSKITIYHGEKGEKGDPGAQGNPGTPGAQGDPGTPGNDGAPGTTPVIGVKEYEGVYYWTVNGEFMKDDLGHLIPVTGNDGAAGAAGADGKTPQLRINEGNWEVSYDGENWTVVGPAQTAATAVDAVFSGVKETKDQVVFTLVDGTKLSIDKLVEFSLAIDDSQAYDVVEGKTTEIPYTLKGVGSGTSRVDAVASGDWWAEVQAADTESGILKVTAGAAAKAKVILYAVDGKGRSDIRSLVFNSGTLSAVAPVADSPADGGDVAVPVVTNVDYTVEIEEEAQSWISYIVTKGGEVHNETLTLTVQKNHTPATRSGLVQLKDMSGAVIQEFTVKQESGVYEYPVFEDNSFKNWVLYNSPASDQNDNMKVDASEAAKVTELNISTDYTSLKGIECFYNLKKLTISATANLTTLDLSKNKNLQELTISKAYGKETALTTLDLSDLRALKTVQLGGMTGIATLTLGAVPKLTSLIAYNTAITALDLSGAPELTNLTVYGTKLVSLDLSNNTKLESASLGAATLTSVVFPANPVLNSLNIENTAITELDLSKLTELTTFTANSTKLVNIDLSGSAKLSSFSVGYSGTGSSNTLKKVDIRKAVNLSTCHLYSTVLEEVIVPKGTNTSSWDWKSYTMNPDTGETTNVKITEIEVEGGGESVDDYAAGIKEPFVKKLVLAQYDTNGDGALDAAEAENVTELDLSERGLVDGDLEGLEVFPVKKLLLNGNKFTQFDVLAWPKIEWLNLNDNKLTSLSIGSKTADLKQDLHLEAARNQIATFTSPYYSKANVNYLDLSNNKLSGSSLTVYSWSNLKYVNFANNQLTSVYFGGLYALEEINISNNKFTSAAYTSFTKLKKVDVSHNNITTYGFGASQYDLVEVNLGYNKITSVDITNIAKNASAFKLSKIDVTGNEGFNLVIVGAGNNMPAGLEIIGCDDYVVLNAATPSGYAYNNGSNIKSAEAISKAEFGDITLNYTLKTKGFKIEDGGSAKIVAKANKRRLVIFAVATSGTPEISIERSSGKSIFTKETDKPLFSGYGATGSNPFTPALNEYAAKDWTSFIQDGNNGKVFYHLATGSYSASGGDPTVEDEEITFSVSGGTAVIFGISLENYRWDEANM